MPSQAPKHPPIANGKRTSVKGLRGNRETIPKNRVVKWHGFKMKIIVLVNVLKYICKAKSVKQRIPYRISGIEGLRPLPVLMR